MSASIRVLSTKKLQSNQKQYLLNAGFAVIDADFISIEPLPFSVEASAYDMLIFSSQNAVEQVLSIQEEIKDKPVLCVGEKTKKMLVEHGFTVVAQALSAEELIGCIEDKYFANRFIFFCGKQKLDTIPHFLKTKKIQHTLVEVYETHTNSLTILSKADVLLFFSPSGVKSFLKNNKITDETCFCIGQTTAKALEHLTNKIIIASQPSVENVIVQVINYLGCQASKGQNDNA